MPISHQKVPNGGWVFFEEKTKVKIVGMTWDDLVKCIKLHRRSNGIDQGDVELDLAEQIAKKHPELVT